ncbi:hypothetical protein [Shewanella woodyi]|uniref:hypothetical protein n=1 Tax=Shewanella woodyi TaxID=60961 RepID=UPI0007F93AD2|nr:hypothetical protein [Shewanella woodyi]
MYSDKLIGTICNMSWLSHSGVISDLLKQGDEWEWLPTSRDSIDPFCCQFARSPKESDVYKATLKSLRRLGESIPNLVDGPNDYTNAFKGAALYTFKMAARELFNKTPRKWVELASIYESGKWPLGITQSGRIIVL